MNFSKLEQYFSEVSSYLIYGAGVVAYQTFVAVKELYGTIPIAFIVSEENKKQENIAGIPIINLKDVSKKDLDKLIMIATPEIYHAAIIDNLQSVSANQYCCVDTHMEYWLMSRYFRKTGKFSLLEDLEMQDKKNARINANQFSVYMAKSHKDVPLQNVYEIPEWMIPVQGGVSCTDKAITGVIYADNEGENISSKNRDYCELTVTYWAWKNKHSTYKGICHYRRMLLLQKEDLQKCISNDVDVILPLPFICYPNATGQYMRYIKASDRKNLEKVINEICPEYLEVLKKVDREQYLYNYNMLIAKEKIFDDYAKWLFRVLECVEKYCEPNGIKRNDRYAGYLGELLTTLYFVKNKDRYNIVHAEKN